MKLGSGYKLRYNHVQSESIFWVWLPVSDRFTILFCFVSCFTTAPNGVIESELTNGRELRALWVSEALNEGTPHVWGLPVPVPHDQGEGVFPSWRTSQKSLVQGAWVHVRLWWWWQSCNSSLHMFCTFIHNGNSNDALSSIVYATEISHWCHRILRLCKPSAQFQD